MLVIIGFIIVIALVVIGFFISQSILDRIDREKMTKLDTDMRSLYDTIKKSSSGNDNWKYANVCSPVRSGPWPTGDYNCITSISLEKTITSATEVKEYHAKYYPIIDKNPLLIKSGELDEQPVGVFGSYFVVSSAEKRYLSSSTKTDCRYLESLHQTQANELTKNYQYGSDIDNGQGRFIISLRCDETARDKWYPKVNSTSMLIP